MRKLFAIIAIAAFAAMPAFAQARPWEKDERLLTTTLETVQQGGILAVRPSVPELEQALAGAPAAFEAAAKGDDNGKQIVLADGQAETLMLLMAAAGSDAKTGTVAYPNPYPAISLILGSYYNELDQPTEAVRVLDAGLNLPATDLGAYQPALHQERGTALGPLNRHAEQLADFDAGLRLPSQTDEVKARFMRGRGLALTDLGRLDEAEAAFRDSLKLAPNNPIALGELKYIDGLRKGATPTKTITNKLQKPDGK